MDLLKTTALGLSIGTFGMLTSYKDFIIPRMIICGVDEGVYQVRRNRTEEILERILPQTISSLEQELDVTFNGEPKFDFERSLLERNDDFGTFSPITNTIFINPDFAMVDDMFLNLACYGSCAPIERTLRHELGHYYAQERIDAHGFYNWGLPSRVARLIVAALEQNPLLNGFNTYTFEQHPLIQEILAQTVVQEGIGRYFEYRGPDNQTNSDCVDIHGRITFEQQGTMYAVGYALVSPIIKEHGEKGILYLLQHPPKDTFLLGDYQRKALTQLAR